MPESPILAEINRLSNKKYRLYRQLDYIIGSAGLHVGYAQPQTIEIKEIEGQLTRLWSQERARGKVWFPRLREGKSGRGRYQRPLQRKVHGYRR